MPRETLRRIQVVTLAIEQAFADNRFDEVSSLIQERERLIDTLASRSAGKLSETDLAAALADSDRVILSLHAQLQSLREDLAGSFRKRKSHQGYRSATPARGFDQAG